MIYEGGRRMIVWNEKYSCGVESIDQQHKRLFELGAHLFTLLEEVGEYDQFDDILAVLQEMKDYTVYHFDYEEKLLEQNGYEGEKLEEQKQQHKKFIEELQFIDDPDFIDRRQRGSIMSLISLVMHWIEKHILESDMQYKDFLQEKVG